MQQIRQIPIFLGRRRRRSPADHDVDVDVDDAGSNSLDQSAAFDVDPEARDMDLSATSDKEPDRPDGQPLEEIKFMLNGKEQQYVVAKQVEAMVDLSSDMEDLGP